MSSVMQFVGAAEIALLLGVSRQRVHQLVTATGFPQPLERLAAGAIWSTDDVTAWAEEHGREAHPERLGEPPAHTDTPAAP